MLVKAFKLKSGISCFINSVAFAGFFQIASFNVSPTLEIQGTSAMPSLSLIGDSFISLEISFKYQFLSLLIVLKSVMISIFSLRFILFSISKKIRLYIETNVNKNL